MSLLSTIAIKGGTIYATSDTDGMLGTPNKFTLQVYENTHIILSPDVLHFVKDSCNPNMFFDTTTFELVTIGDIVKEN